MHMRGRQITGFIAVVAACFALGMLIGWSGIAARIDHYAYDWMSSPPADPKPESVVIAIDEATLEARQGIRNLRGILAQTLDELQVAQPKVVAIDITLPDNVDEELDANLEEALRATRNLILPCQLVNGKWEDPAPRFKPFATALGHVHPEQDRLDGVSRQISLEQAAAGQRRWALALEAFRIARGEPLVESPEDIQIGPTVIPASRASVDGIIGRPLYLRYMRPGTVPRVSALDILQHTGEIRGKTAFIGVTALDATRDRIVNPYGANLPGVEEHVHAFETLVRGDFLTPAKDSLVLLLCAIFAAAAGLGFAILPASMAYVTGGALIVTSLSFPFLLFSRGIVLPYSAPVAVTLLTSMGAATYQHFFVRRQLARSESEKSRYQQAIHWAAHEMRTPLTSIQGSSEIMSKYNLPEAKQHQLSEMINSESKRLSRIIQTFLDVERLADGQMEMKRESFSSTEILHACFDRVVPIAERKRIAISIDAASDATLTGDRELMEYALYNLMTNAVKYSPAKTEVHVSSALNNGEVRLAVRDQGIGMDAKEQKQVFQKFFRTKSAEASGEVGTGIGLSIVDQIVTHHGGRIELSSAPGQGSCFTIVLKAS